MVNNVCGCGRGDDVLEGNKKNTPSVSNYRSFDFFDLKFDHSSYSKICAKHNFFCCGLLYQYKIFKNDLNLIMFAQIF